MGVIDPAERLWQRPHILGTTYQLPLRHHELIRQAANQGLLMRLYNQGCREFILPGTGTVYELLSFDLKTVVLSAVRGPIPRQERLDLEMALYSTVESLSEAVDCVLEGRAKQLAERMALR